MTSSGITGATALGAIPSTLRDELLDAYRNISTNYREGRWEPSELNGGKLCEIVYSILQGYVSGSFPLRSSKPADMVGACRKLEQAPTTFLRSVRVQIPRMLIALYEVRNNRSVGHVGGEVNPNQMDATFVFYAAKWIVAELVRLFHRVSPSEATAVVEVLIERELPSVWRVGATKRALPQGIKRKDLMLLLLYGESNPVHEGTLADWLDAGNVAAFRRDVIRPGHKARLIEYNKADRTITLSPVGVRRVEKELPLTV